MISQFTPATNGICRFILQLESVVLRIILTLQSLTPKDLKTTVGKSPPTVFQAIVVIPLITPVATIHTKSMNGTKQESHWDSIGIVLLFVSIRGYESPMRLGLPLIGY